MARAQRAEVTIIADYVKKLMVDGKFPDRLPAPFADVQAIAKDIAARSDNSLIWVDKTSFTFFKEGNVTPSILLKGVVIYCEELGGPE